MTYDDVPSTINTLTGLYTVAGLGATGLIKFLPPADDSRDGVNSKWYAVLYGIIRRLSLVAPTPPTSKNGTNGPA